MKVGIRPIEGGRDFSGTMAQALAAERLGFDSVWYAEHYTPDEHWWPAGLLNLAAVAARTEEIEIGTNILITPFYHPVWLASAGSMLDIISEGRFVCGLGVGYDPVEFEAFDVDLDERVGRTIETVILLKRLWTRDEVTYEGQYYSLDGFELAPKPLRDPRPPIWMGVWGDYLLSQAAKRADAWIPGTAADLDQLMEKRAVYDEHLEGSPGCRPLLRDIVVADSRSDALDRAERYLAPKYDVYADRGHQYFTEYHATPLEEFLEDRAIVGTPDDCIEQIQTYRDRFDVDHLMFRFTYHGMTVDDGIDQLERIATEVLPSF